MGKRNLACLGLTAAFLLTGCADSSSLSGSETSSSPFSSSSPSSDSSISSSEPGYRKVQLFDNSKFDSGFNLLTPSTDNGRTVARYIDYQGTASPTRKDAWYMAQWWTPYDFKDAPETKVGDEYVYQNESRVLKVNPQTGHMEMGLNSWTEYQKKLGGSRSSSSQGWSHFLIEQSFTNRTKIAQADKIIVSLDFQINEVTQYDLTHYNANMHAAQFLWYFTIQNLYDQSLPSSENGTYGDYLWFGIPIYDSRYSYVAPYANVDSGTTGSTNKLIYAMDNRTYLPNYPLVMGQQYHIEFDVLPYVKDAFVYGVLNGALKNAQFGNMEFNYMNLGWELPGSFAINSEIQNISAEVYYADK